MLYFLGYTQEQAAWQARVSAALAARAVHALGAQRTDSGRKR